MASSDVRTVGPGRGAGTATSTAIDTEALARLSDAADAELDGILSGGLEPAYRARWHRGLMAMVKAAVVAHRNPRSRWADDGTVVARAGEWLTDLESLQAPGGLFAGGDNLASPPDSGFTVTDVAVVVDLLRRHPDPALDHLAVRLTAVLDAAAGALVTGGVHTPNHRWELAGALARTGALLGDDTLLERARTWLAEGIDVDADGLYSERSPNYAAHVSNPSLTALADLLGRRDLHDIVHRSLHAQLALTDSHGWVETVHSRRQDQSTPFPLGPFLGQLRRSAILSGCARCADGARLAARTPGVDAVDILVQLLADPRLAGRLPEPAPGAGAPGGRRYFSAARLLVDDRAAGRAGSPARLTVYGGSDVPVARRVASGLACNPTFLRAARGGAVLRSVRLSRDFFGLGPFRAASMDVDGDRVTLREDVSASYYGPLEPSLHRVDGAYALEHEGRFAASMGFADRARDVVTLTTAVGVDLHDDGVDLTITTDGPATAHALELALAPGGTMTGAAPLGDDRFQLVDGTARWSTDTGTVVVGPGYGGGPDRPAVYRPGEAYTFLGGTDALSGPRLYVTWRSPGTVTVHVRLEPAPL